MGYTRRVYVTQLPHACETLHKAHNKALIDQTQAHNCYNLVAAGGSTLPPLLDSVHSCATLHSRPAVSSHAGQEFV